MTPHWTLRLTCQTCTADVQYTDEVPDFKTDTEMAAALEEARTWVSANPTTAQQGVAIRSPLFAGYTRGTSRQDSKVRTFVLNVDPRYIACPVCESSIYLSPSARKALTAGRW